MLDVRGRIPDGGLLLPARYPAPADPPARAGAAPLLAGRAIVLRRMR